MPRSIWNGAISFGLVNVPVQLYSAVEQKDIHFSQFSPKGNKVRYRRVDEKTGREVDYSDIVRGYEVSRGKFVTVTDEELESVEPGKSRTIEIEDFVDLHEIDPIYYDKTYYIAPQSAAGADKAYALLREAMERSERVAIGRFVMRTKEYLTAIRPSGNLLVLQTMNFPDEVRDPKELDIPSKRVKPGDRELRIATQLIDSLTTDFAPRKYKDRYRRRVEDLIKRKGKGEEITVTEREPERAEVVDLFDALQASLEGAKQGARASRSRARRKRAS